MKNDPIYVWVSDGCAWIRVTGDACVLNATRVKEFGIQMIKRGIREFAVDLEECTGMDSTFMGMLTFLALSLRQRYTGSVRVLNIPDEQEKYIRELGLDQIFVCE